MDSLPNLLIFEVEVWDCPQLLQLAKEMIYSEKCLNPLTTCFFWIQFNHLAKYESIDEYKGFFFCE